MIKQSIANPTRIHKTANLTARQISLAIDRLPDRAKTQIADKLQSFTAKLLVRRILNKVDSRRKPKMTINEILAEIHAYRQEKHAQGRR